MSQAVLEKKTLGRRPGRRSYSKLQTKAVAKEISVDAETTAPSELDGNITLSEKQTNAQNCPEGFSTMGNAGPTLTGVPLHTAVHSGSPQGDDTRTTSCSNRSDWFTRT